MRPDILREVLQGVHTAFGDMEYGVIGGAALAIYNKNCQTSDVDVMIPAHLSEVVHSQLLSGGMVRTAIGGLGYAKSYHPEMTYLLLVPRHHHRSDPLLFHAHLKRIRPFG
jgi:hypothetical protein